MRLIAIVPLALAVAACSLPGSQVDDGPGIVGTYVVNGVDPLGVEYSGTVVISEGDAVSEFVMTWLVTGAIHEGTGILVGEELRVEWVTVQGPRGDSTGAAVYTLGEDGTLVGTRTVDGLEGAGTEEIFPSG
ncbi:MAG TPA: hypothetical protein VIY70_04210 [Acidimicrobiia bacterium]